MNLGESYARDGTMFYQSVNSTNEGDAGSQDIVKNVRTVKKSNVLLILILAVFWAAIVVSSEAYAEDESIVTAEVLDREKSLILKKMDNDGVAPHMIRIFRESVLGSFLNGDETVAIIMIDDSPEFWEYKSLAIEFRNLVRLHNKQKQEQFNNRYHNDPSFKAKVDAQRAEEARMERERREQEKRAIENRRLKKKQEEMLREAYAAKRKQITDKYLEVNDYIYTKFDAINRKLFKKEEAQKNRTRKVIADIWSKQVSKKISYEKASSMAKQQWKIFSEWQQKIRSDFNSQKKDKINELENIRKKFINMLDEAEKAGNIDAVNDVYKKAIRVLNSETQQNKDTSIP